MGPETLAFLQANAVPLGLAAGGSLLQMVGQREAADDRRAILNRQMARDSEATDKAIDLTQQEAQRFDPQARQQALAEQEAKTFDQTQADLRGGAGLVQTAGDPGNVSQDFLATKAQRAIDEGTRLTSIAREAAKVRAPSQVASDDALSRAGLAGNLQNLWGTNKNMGNAASLAASSVEEPAYAGLGSIASAIGTGMLKGGIKKPTWQSGIDWSDPMRAGAYR